MVSLDYEGIMESRKGVLLWDIDGTLIRKKASLAPSSHQKVLGLRKNQRIEFGLSGLSDWDVMVNLAKKYGINDSKLNHSFDQLLIDNNEISADQYELCKGVNKDLLLELSRDWHLGILTGNTENRALSKLKSTQIYDCFTSEFFFTCQKGESRQDIGVRAQEHLKNNKTIIIGDTPRDIEVARTLDWLVIAVTTGEYDLPRLMDYSPDFIIENCQIELERILASI